MNSLEEKEQKWCGLRIRQRRKQRGWSQEALSHGICSVSYLSKIESGSAVPAPEVLELLAERLSLTLPHPSHQDQDREQRLLALLESGQMEKARQLWQTLDFSSGWKNTVTALLLSAFFAPDEQNRKSSILPDGIESSEMEHCLNPTQRSLWLLLQSRYQSVWQSSSEPWILCQALYGLYHQRISDAQILVLAEKAYQRASEEGYPRIMASISHLQAVVCSNIPDYESARHYFRRTRHLLESLEDTAGLDELSYNEACIAFECGEFQTAIQVLESVTDRSVMDIQKLSLSYELSGNRKQALETINTIERADYQDWDPVLIGQIASLSRIRLQDPHYLDNPDYGTLLMEVFRQLSQSGLHKGYAQFYLPWVIQWLKSCRQYAKLVSILETFPGKPLFSVA